MTKMRSDRLKIVFMLCLAFVTSGGKYFESKVAQLIRDETEDIKCFVEGKKDFTCFWEKEDGTNYSQDNYTFTYTYMNENKMDCAVSSLFLLSSNRSVFFCKLPKALFFTSLDVQVLRDGQMLYNRSLNVENILLTDPPRNVTVWSSGKEGQLNVSWLPPAVKYIDDSLIYEVRYAVEDSHMGKVEETKASTMLVLRGLQPDTRYKVWVRVKPDGVSYKGYWSSWTSPVIAVTPPGSMDPLIVLLVVFIILILCLLSMTVILSHHKFLLKKLWPDIPTPEHKFPGLFTVYKGDFKEWMSQNSGSMWARSVQMYTEELPSPLEVLSEVSLSPLDERKLVRDEDQRSDSGLTEPPHWLMEQLRALQENPESLSRSTLLQSHDTYITLNHSSGGQREDDVFEETLPLQTLFTSAGTSSINASHSDLGSLRQSSASGRLSSQSSFEDPNHPWPPKGPGYAYMAVADSGVSLDYSPMSSSRIIEIGKRSFYANEYKNEIFGYKWPFSAQQVQSGY
ncbi:erythropoietin receptor precursor [Danio rerio]|uniref:Erythropoietin receptor n=1 Tax=Danio rerio TaxID=7955 RepID=Q2VBQ8_DANRE|nr:erythropoietin receptor precursor [Danio rerio]ABB77800.1 erythropoietin receptor [Danio rerio]|eukprot:NP_001036799.1 erythropoietin receptor precursor [Danio rerio]